MKKYKTGLVLSGGGTRGFAHLGVIAALYENGIQPDVISGVSAGAITGAFIAAGKSPQETMEIFKKGWFFRYSKIQIPVNGLFRLDGLKEVIEREIEVKNIENLEIPFFIGASNLNNGNIEYINHGPISQWVLASSSIPVLFSPVKVKNTLYADGGIVDNVPTQPIKDDCDIIIAVNISPINPKENLKNLPQIALRTLYMSVNANAKDVKKNAHIYIEPEGIDKYDILNRSHAKELFEIGYNSAKNIRLPK
jgi:NTE family protein